ncbi:MAG: hypothetical protein HZA24_03535 [Nitrospirae bacterium]|nr:hypothetical protein [Nitrospirota bacterium]
MIRLGTLATWAGLLLLLWVDNAHALKAGLTSEASGRVAYLNLTSSDPAATELEDVQTTEGIAAQLDLDNAYLHLDMRYQVIAGQLAHNAELNYLEHSVVFNLNLDRWLEQHSEAGKVDITLAVDTSPSLPPLEDTGGTSAALPLGGDPAAMEAQNLLGQSRPPSDMLNLREDRSGYGLRYGITYSDTAGPVGRYHAGWLVRDSRYKGGVVPNQSSLNVNGGYMHRLLRGEAGFTVIHNRLLRGGTSQQRTYSLSGVYNRPGYRYSWGTTLGTTYLVDGRDYVARASAHASRRAHQIRVSGSADTDVAVVDVGRTALRRRHQMTFKVEPVTYATGAVWLTASGSVAEAAKRAEAGINRLMFLGDKSGLYADIGYKWSGIWWDDVATGLAYRSTSNTVGFNIIWRFL